MYANISVMEPEKILVVDDEPIVRESFKAAFEEYRIITASNGNEALNILAEPNDIDLVVVDVNMPGINGLELLKKIKEQDQKYKVVILTAFASKGIAIDALRSKADEFIEKPFDIDQTKQIFERLLSETRHNQAENYPGNPRKAMNMAKRFIERNYYKGITLEDVAKEVYLSPKYFSRVFKSRTGKSFNEYKIYLRMELAKRLLKKNHHTISQIGYRVGYQTPEAFMKLFKKTIGQSPSEYRNSDYKKNSPSAVLEPRQQEE